MNLNPVGSLRQFRIIYEEGTSNWDMARLVNPAQRTVKTVKQPHQILLANCSIATSLVTLSLSIPDEQTAELSGA